MLTTTTATSKINRRRPILQKLGKFWRRKTRSTVQLFSKNFLKSWLPSLKSMHCSCYKRHLDFPLMLDCSLCSIEFPAQFQASTLLTRHVIGICFASSICHSHGVGWMLSVLLQGCNCKCNVVNAQ